MKTKKITILLLLFSQLAIGSSAPYQYANKIDPELIVAATILAEARGEGETGMKAVGQVILNRSRGRNLPCEAVCLQPWQFSCWNNTKPVLRQIEGLMSESEAATSCALAIAAFICSGVDVLPCFSYNHYYAHKHCYPSWARDAKSVKIIGNHIFLTL